MKTAIVTGITGQDGAYLARYLLEKGYHVTGTYRRTSTVNFWRLQALGIEQHPQLDLRPLDLTDAGNCLQLIAQVVPDEIYNLAAQSFVGISFEQPLATASITGVGVLNLLEAVRFINPQIRFYQASTSEMFGQVQQVPQTEKTPFYPRSPYAVAKLFAHWSVINYRESYNIFASSGILFNHESPLRGQEFVTRKITRHAARVAEGEACVLELGNLDAQRDWGYAPEYVEGMHAMLQHDVPDTFVLATNTTHTVRSFVEEAYKAVGIQLDWSGQDASEQAHNASSGELLVRVNPQFYRPAEVDLLIGDYTHAREKLGWQPNTTMQELCQLMVDDDRHKVRTGYPY